MPVGQDKSEKNRYALARMMNEQDLDLKQSGASYNRVKRIINKLSSAASVYQELDVYTVDGGDDVNAFAMGGNTIVVYQELINRLPDDEELAVILGHEMAHILGQHNSDRTEQKRGAAWGLVSAAVGAAVTIATDGSTLAADLAQTGTQVVGAGVVKSYGRAMEHEADHIGMLLMAKAGYDPATAITVWGKADTVLGKGGSLSFFSSHPSHGNRKERLEQDYVLAEPIYRAAKN